MFFRYPKGCPAPPSVKGPALLSNVPSETFFGRVTLLKS